MVLVILGLVIAYVILFRSRSLVSYIMLMQHPSTLIVELLLLGLALYNPLTLILLAGVVYMSLKRRDLAQYVWAGFGMFVLLGVMVICLYLIIHAFMA